MYEVVQVGLCIYIGDLRDEEVGSAIIRFGSEASGENEKVQAIYTHTTPHSKQGSNGEKETEWETKRDEAI